ncbi:MAG: helix-turn-helix transcriptional regulator [Chloroflexi bacterium]|nr:helix-turn-helix transcriptional regulator [Chloroflexota bacterium]
MQRSKAKQRNLTVARRGLKRRALSFVGNIRHPIMARFGAALRERRKQQGMTQAELAVAAGLSRSYLSEVECGQESISLERAERLAEALGCKLSDLLQGD